MGGEENLHKFIVSSTAATLVVSLFHTQAVLEGPAEQSQHLARPRKRRQRARQSEVKPRAKQNNAKDSDVEVVRRYVLVPKTAHFSVLF